jgi:hypothetical protein
MSPKQMSFVLVMLLGVAASFAVGAALPLDLTVSNPLAESRNAVPVTWGVPLALEDGVTDPCQVTLLRDGVPVTLQATPFARWNGAPDDATKPIAWLLLDFQLDLPPGGSVALQLVPVARTDEPSPLRITRDDSSGVTVETGAATYQLSKTAFRLFDAVSLAGGVDFPGGGGISYEGSVVVGPATITVEHRGTERISLRVHGAVSGDLEYTLRLHFYRGLAEVRGDFRLENFSPYAWLDNQPLCNDYGTAGSVHFDDLSLVFPGSGERDFLYASGEGGSGSTVTGAYATSMSLIQESSGDENWNALLTEAPRLQSGVAKRASTIRLDGAASDGPNRLGGWLDAGGVTAAVEGFWQNFPKALRAREGAMEVGLFPGEFSRDHELRSGEFKTHSFWVCHDAKGGDSTAHRARSALAPPRADAPPEAVVRNRAAGPFAPRDRATFPLYEDGVDYQVVESPEYADRPWESAGPTVLASVSLSQHYGWVDYGDIPTDFEPFRDWVGPPFNLKYDGVRGMVYQAMRTGDAAWWEMARAGARHSGDIDVLHSRNRGRTSPRAWPDGGMYGHGYHDERGNTNPHRNFMNPSMSMTGPPPGLFLWAWLSGDTLVLDSALELSENAYWRTVNSSYPDDGGCASALRQCTTEPWTCEGWEEVDGGRTGANAIKTFLAAYFATGDREYLDVISRVAAYVKCMEDRNGHCCNRYHMNTTLEHNLGHYLIFRRWAGLGEDATALQLLRDRITYQLGHLWNAAAGSYSMCYTCDGDPDPEDCDESFMCPITDNWALSAADSFGLASILLEDPSLLVTARRLFDIGTPHPMGGDSTLAYHFSKEFVNQVGFGHYFLYAWDQAHAGCSVTCMASASPSAGYVPLQVSFSATAQATGCAGAPSYAWTFGDGATSAAQNPTYTYATAGTYGWSLTVAVDGQTCTRTGNITVNPLVDCYPECATTVPISGVQETDIPFQSTVRALGFCTGEEILTYAWDFGDGATSPAQDPTHSYAAVGTYNWSMTATLNQVTCTGTGTIAIHAPGTGVPGDCDGDGSASIGEVQKAINMFLGTLVPGCGVDCNGDGTVSIGEVQKVINAFLGLAVSC